MNMPLMQLLFGFQGRIRRTAWWLASFGFGFAWSIALIMVIGIVALMGAAATGGASDNAAAGALGALIALVYLIGLVPAVWVGIALGVKRCHDRDKPGVFMLLYLIPIVGPIWILIELGFLDGTPGPNQYGPSPKGLEGVHAAPAPNVYT